MAGLTADKDFGEGGGLAVGVLDHHCVGGCVLNGASEKQGGRGSPRDGWAPRAAQVPVQVGCGGKGGLTGRPGEGLQALGQGLPLRSWGPLVCHCPSPRLQVLL